MRRLFGVSTKVAPTKIEDVQALMTRLSPLLASRSDASVLIWGDGEVNIKIEIRGNSVRGKGRTLQEAIFDICKWNNDIRAALQP